MSAENIFTANWKLDGNRKSANVWVNAFNEGGRELITPGNRIIVAPPLYLLSTVADQIEAYGLTIAVAAQDLDPKADALFYDKNGVKHTGQEYVPFLIADCAEYVILGHSERRRDNSLTDDDVNLRLDIARKHNLKPIVCVANTDQARAITQHDPNFSGIIAYEPPGNIGTGIAANFELANQTCEEILQMFPSVNALYGGSVDDTNIKKFLSQPAISGVLIGNKSSGAKFFQDTIRAALS